MPRKKMTQRDKLKDAIDTLQRIATHQDDCDMKERAPKACLEVLSHEAQECLKRISASTAT